ncbi:serine hydrolase domain-containing protein [Myxococcus landrumensis]|uniref:Beta-lactamase family protein n=1 Tax=Myxococcus landrumensis TaxID=2813577 RepID=A0ABX7N579_9BACT|nr:serine hydrolase domain-containing protein [Myxococcus landrumus]QSQ13880.1 beta-lactamase family protein [Myxococcus landrumus]
MRASLRCLSLSMVFLVGLLVSSAASAHDSLRERLDAFVRAEQKRQKVPGVAVAVVSRGRVVLAKGYGLSNLEHQVPVTTDTLFQSGSLGKQFTAMAVMLQVEAGRIALSDSITKYFPDAPATWAPITIRHLLTHTAGIGELDGLIDVRKDYTDEELAQFIYGLPLDFPAGLRWSYSNSGYVLLGLLVNRVAGTSYVNVLGEHVFTPARMKTARGISEEDIVPNRAAGYRMLDGVVKNQQWVSPSLNTTGDGALYFSLKDLVAWDAAVDDRALLTKASWRDILSPAKLNSGAPYPYGFGWVLEERNGRPVHQHTGAWQGFKSAFFRFVEDDVSVIVLLNLADANPEPFANGLAAIVNPALAVPPLEPIPDLEPELTARCATLLEQMREGTLNPAEFAYVPWWFFSEAVPFYQALLQRLGPSGPLALVKREVRGDDRVSTYLVQVGPMSLRYRVALIPDGRVSVFSLSPN